MDVGWGGEGELEMAVQREKGGGVYGFGGLFLKGEFVSCWGSLIAVFFLRDGVRLLISKQRFAGHRYAKYFSHQSLRISSFPFFLFFFFALVMRLT